MTVGGGSHLIGICSLGFDVDVVGVSNMNSATCIMNFLWHVVVEVWLKRFEFRLIQMFERMKGSRVEYGVLKEAFVVWMVVSLLHLSFNHLARLCA